MTTENKIKEIEQKQNFQSDWFEEALQEMAEWKDEQHEKEKQQMIEKTISFLQDFHLTHNYVDIMVIEDEYRKLMEE